MDDKKKKNEKTNLYNICFKHTTLTNYKAVIPKQKTTFSILSEYFKSLLLFMDNDIIGCVMYWCVLVQFSGKIRCTGFCFKDRLNL